MKKKTWSWLRKKYPSFVYESFSWEIKKRNLVVSFVFKIPPDISFSSRVVIENVDRKRVKRIGERAIAGGTPDISTAIDNLVFNLGLVEMLSYWKSTCSPEIVIRRGFLNKRQIAWWQDLIKKGLGQYFFENKINFVRKDLVKITSVDAKTSSYQKSTIVAKRYQLKKSFLVPLGGGKDSIVTLEILKEAYPSTSLRSSTPRSLRLEEMTLGETGRVNCFSLNPNEAVTKVMKIAGCLKPVVVRRRIDPRLLELNRQGFLNGHTPFSAYLAFLSVLCAVVFDYKYIALSNERSANEGNVEYLGKMINHQYSKSFEFEQKFRHYTKKYLSPSVEYFSFLRPLYELQIAELFSRYPKYFQAFLSCNQALATKSGTQKPSGRRCGHCPKCLFVFISLVPFLGKERTTEIFGKNLLEDKTLWPLKQQLLGGKGIKPFECVGTAKETRAALTGQGLDKILRSWNDRHNLPRGLARILRQEKRP